MSICDVPVISTVCETVGEGAATLVAAPFDWLAQSMGSTAGYLFEAVWQVYDTTTLVDVTSPGYLRVYNLLFGVAVFIALAFFCLQLVTGLLRREPSALGRAGTGLAKSILGSFVLITITGLLLEITDQLSVGIIQAAGETVAGMGDRLLLLHTALSGINIATPGVGAIITIFLAGLSIAATVIVWFSLLIRKALLLIGIVFGPVALAGFSWDATRGWFPKWATFVVALIASKLVVTVIFLVAITQVSAPITPDLASISDPIAGIVLLFMAAFAPYLAFKFLSFVGFDMYQAMSMEQESKQALNRPLPIPNRPQGRPPKQVLDSGAGKADGGQAAPPKPAPMPASTPASTAPASAGTPAVAGTGAAAAVPPVAAALLAAQAAKAAAEAGPQLGQLIGSHADGQAAAADPVPPQMPHGQQPPPVLPPLTSSAAPPQAATPPVSNPKG